MEKLNKILNEIKEAHEDFREPNKDLLKFMYNSTDKTQFVETLQEECNRLYDKHGLDDAILSLQVYINQHRHEHDIMDYRESMLNDDGQRYVQ